MGTITEHDQSVAVTWLESDPSARASLQAFLAKHFSATAPQNKPRWLDWMLANPRGTRVCGVIDQDQIVAVSFFLPVTIRLRSNLHHAAFSVSTMVAPERRGQGLGTKLHQTRLAMFELALSSGQSEANKRIYKNLGFREIASYQCYQASAAFPKWRFERSVLRDYWSWLTFAFRKLPLPKWQHAHHQTTGFLPADWRDPREDWPGWCTVSTREDLLWRYDKHPYLSYQYTAFYDNGLLKGFVVHRQGHHQIIMVDLYAAEEDISRVMMAFARVHSRQVVWGLAAGTLLADLKRQAGYHRHPHGSAVMAGSRQQELVDQLLDTPGCFFAGVSDKDR